MKFVKLLISLISLSLFQQTFSEEDIRKYCKVDYIYYTYQPTEQAYKESTSIPELSDPYRSNYYPNQTYSSQNLTNASFPGYFNQNNTYQGYNPYAVYISNYNHNHVIFSVIHERDMQNFKVMGNLIWKDVKSNEYWYIHGKSKEIHDVGFEACKKLHKDYSNTNFDKLLNKISPNFPSLLSIREQNYQRIPEIKVPITNNVNNPDTVLVPRKHKQESARSNKNSILDIKIDIDLKKAYEKGIFII